MFRYLEKGGKTRDAYQGDVTTALPTLNRTALWLKSNLVLPREHWHAVPVQESNLPRQSGSASRLAPSILPTPSSFRIRMNGSWGERRVPGKSWNVARRHCRLALASPHFSCRSQIVWEQPSEVKEGMMSL